MAHVGQVVVQSQAVLNTEHDGLAAFALVFIEVGGGAGYADIVAFFGYYLLELVEDEVGILCRRHLCGESVELWIVPDDAGDVHFL